MNAQSNFFDRMKYLIRLSLVCVSNDSAWDQSDNSDDGEKNEYQEKLMSSLKEKSWPYSLNSTIMGAGIQLSRRASTSGEEKCVMRPPVMISCASDATQVSPYTKSSPNLHLNKPTKRASQSSCKLSLESNATETRSKKQVTVSKKYSNYFQFRFLNVDNKSVETRTAEKTCKFRFSPKIQFSVLQLFSFIYFHNFLRSPSTSCDGFPIPIATRGAEEEGRPAVVDNGFLISHKEEEWEL